MELFLVAASLHLGLESLVAAGHAAEEGFGQFLLLLLGLVDLRMLLLHVSLEQAGAGEPLVDPGPHAGVAEVALLFGPDLLLPPMDSGEVAGEVRLLREGGGAQAVLRDV